MQPQFSPKTELMQVPHVPLTNIMNIFPNKVPDHTLVMILRVKNAVYLGRVKTIRIILIAIANRPPAPFLRTEEWACGVAYLPINLF
jgi:hypothetical protein